MTSGGTITAASARAIPAFAATPVLAARGALAVVLGALSRHYGYHRDEL